jgi:8-oxo-dGTP pyrophosphatase MutT (NUDIX family)
VSSIPERLTVRVLLLDDEDRVLLMKGRFPNDRTGPGAWFTVGGGADPGESVIETAHREVIEETGLGDVILGPEIWYREGVGYLANGDKVLFRERYLVARSAGGDVSRDGWEAHEHDLVDDMRWWTLADLAATTERVFPEGLAGLLPDILAGRFPAEPLVLRKVEPRDA